MKTTITLDPNDILELICSTLNIPQTLSTKYILTNIGGKSDTTIFEGIEITMYTDVIPHQTPNSK